jgi:hypothetical protein
MENTKIYYVDGKKYTFDVVEVMEVKVPMWYAKCRENGKKAWLDREGIQFEGGERFKASTKPTKLYITYECDPRYPEDCMPITRFHDTLEDAEIYAKRTEQEFCGDICVDIYEAERRN